MQVLIAQSVTNYKFRNVCFACWGLICFLASEL
jgi:hypothetical protein